ncbi:hypothetical protein EJB05_23320, partial [Eragrostis curvula]
MQRLAAVGDPLLPPLYKEAARSAGVDQEQQQQGEQLSRVRDQENTQQEMVKQQRQALPLCMAFLMAFLVVSAMHAVPAEAAGRGGIAYDPLDPNRPDLSPGKPYTRPCLYVENCQSHEP